MNMKKHNCFTLWVHSLDDYDSTVPALEFEDYDFDMIGRLMLNFAELGLVCSLSCETWKEIDKDDKEELSND